MFRGVMTTVIAGLIAVSFLLAPGAFAAERGGTLDDCLYMTIGTVYGMPGEDIMVPVTISETTGWGVMAAEFEICWCELPTGLIQLLGCEAGPVAVNSNWTMGECGVCCPNCITVAAAGAQPLVGQGVLFYIKFHISANAKPCMCCDVKFNEIKLYDPEDPLNVCSTDGKVCIPYCDIMGYVMNWWCEQDPCGDWIRPYPIPEARIHLWDCHGSVATAYSSETGYFDFTCLYPLMDSNGQPVSPDCFYCFDVEQCRLPRSWVSALDASLVLRYLVCSTSLTACSFNHCGVIVYPQQVAADVNCTGVITAYDASLILQFVVGLLPAFPCPDAWVWYRTPCGGCLLDCNMSNKVGIIGLLKGNVNGRPDGGAMLAAPTATVKVGVPQHFDGYVEVPVGVKHADNVFSTQFELAYNADDFDVTQVRGIGLASGMMTAYNADNGNLLIAMAGSGSFSGSGDVAIVTLQKKHTPIPVASTRLEIVGALLNESAPMIEDHQYDSEVVRFALGPVSPNPFTEAAVISFSAPRASGVSIDVYDVHGRLVQTVLSGQVEAGTHQVTWDGCDSSGSKVARGVYFCRMNAGEFNATEKMVMLQ